jgi:hypothetical protein
MNLLDASQQVKLRAQRRNIEIDVVYSQWSESAAVRHKFRVRRTPQGGYNILEVDGKFTHPVMKYVKVA